MQYMVFFVPHQGEVTRTSPIPTYNGAIEAAKNGLSGAKFQITSFNEDGDGEIVMEGFVS